MANLTELESDQMDMYRQVKEVCAKHSFVSLNIVETLEGATVSIKLSKKGKSVGKIRSDYDSQFQR